MAKCTAFVNSCRTPCKILKLKWRQQSSILCPRFHQHTILVAPQLLIDYWVPCPWTVASFIAHLLYHSHPYLIINFTSGSYTSFESVASKCWCLSVGPKDAAMQSLYYENDKMFALQYSTCWGWILHTAVQLKNSNARKLPWEASNTRMHVKHCCS